MTTGSRSSPSSCMRPWATASRSAAPIVTEAHVVPLPAKIRCNEEASPPAAGTGTSAPPGSARKVRGPRFETTMVPLMASRSARHDHMSRPECGSRVTTGMLRRRGHALERRSQHVDRLWAQLVQRAVAVDALAKVDLGQAVGPELLGHVDQQADLDPVAG